MDENGIEEFANKIKDWYFGNGVEITIEQAISISRIDFDYHVIGLPGFASSLLSLIIMKRDKAIEWEKIIDLPKRELNLD